MTPNTCGRACFRLSFHGASLSRCLKRLFRCFVWKYHLLRVWWSWRPNFGFINDMDEKKKKRRLSNKNIDVYDLKEKTGCPWTLHAKHVGWSNRTNNAGCQINLSFFFSLTPNSWGPSLRGWDSIHVGCVFICFISTDMSQGLWASARAQERKRKKGSIAGPDNIARSSVHRKLKGRRVFLRCCSASLLDSYPVAMLSVYYFGSLVLFFIYFDPRFKKCDQQRTGKRYVSSVGGQCTLISFPSYQFCVAIHSIRLWATWSTPLKII